MKTGHVKKHCKTLVLILTILFTLAVIIGFMGCSSGGSTTGSSSSPTTPTSSTGKFVVKVKVPDWVDKSKDVNEKYIPYRADHCTVTITGEAIESGSEPTATENIVGGGTATVTINTVPVGLNVAKIEVFTAGNDLLAESQKGYFQDSTTKDLGTVYLGVALKDGGALGPIYEPTNIDVSYGSTIYFQNWKTAGQDVQLNKDGGAIEKTITVAAATAATQPGTEATYPSESLVCNAGAGIVAGKYVYDNDQGGSGPGYMLVYENPTITDLWASTTQSEGDWPKGAGDDGYVSNTGACTVYYTVAGTNLGESQASVNGSVMLYEWNGTTWEAGVDITGNVTAWTNDYVSGTIAFGADSSAKYRIIVTVRGNATQSTPSTSNMYLFKGSGNVTVDVE